MFVTCVCEALCVFDCICVHTTLHVHVFMQYTHKTFCVYIYISDIFIYMYTPLWHIHQIFTHTYSIQIHWTVLPSRIHVVAFHGPTKLWTVAQNSHAQSLSMNNVERKRSRATVIL